VPYTVSNVPLLLKPLFWLYGYSVAVLIYLVFCFIRITVRIEYKNKELLNDGENYIFSLWHENLIGLFVVYTTLNRDFVWLNHPGWHMKPVHINLGWMGTSKLALGSSGNSGKEALALVIQWLKEGHSTVINPDGPGGPVRVLKDGVLNMSIATGVAVVPFKVTSTRAFTLSTWDRKRVPAPFSKVTVEYGEPMAVTERNRGEARQYLQTSM
jgi:lysophospholipid acyltransferase (LPLAT)-like uncharacterized protein